MFSFKSPKDQRITRPLVLRLIQKALIVTKHWIFRSKSEKPDFSFTSSKHRDKKYHHRRDKSGDSLCWRV